MINLPEGEIFRITPDRKVIVAGDIYDSARAFWELVQRTAPRGWSVEKTGGAMGELGILVKCLNCGILWQLVRSYDTPEGATIPKEELQLLCPVCGSNAYRPMTALEVLTHSLRH